MTSILVHSPKKKHLKLKLSIFHLPELRSFLQLAERRFSVVIKQYPFAVSRKTFRFTFWNFFLRYDPILPTNLVKSQTLKRYPCVEQLQIAFRFKTHTKWKCRTPALGVSNASNFGAWPIVILALALVRRKIKKKMPPISTDQQSAML